MPALFWIAVGLLAGIVLAPFVLLVVLGFALDLRSNDDLPHWQDKWASRPPRP
jgi:hypothetical protein